MFWRRLSGSNRLEFMGIDSYFWRTKSDAELDFITDYEGVRVPVETKSADNTLRGVKRWLR